LFFANDVAVSGTTIAKKPNWEAVARLRANAAEPRELDGMRRSLR
jgi:hypothetical protein